MLIVLQSYVYRFALIHILEIIFLQLDMVYALNLVLLLILVNLLLIYVRHVSGDNLDILLVIDLVCIHVLMIGLDMVDNVFNHVQLVIMQISRRVYV